MQPSRDKKLYYFIIEEFDNYRGFTVEADARQKAYFLGQAIEKGFNTTADVRLREQVLMHLLDGVPKNSTICSSTWRIPVLVKSVEKVINLRGYQHSVEFTIGTSKKVSEPIKYLVGVDFEPTRAQRIVDEISKPDKGIHIEFNWLQLDSINFSQDGFFNTPINTGCNFLESKDNRQMVKDFSYDDHFKYYTLLS